jgi:hypothetical protein
MPWKIATEFTGYIPSASGYATGWTPAHLRMHNWPRRPWRAPDLSSAYVQLEFSGPQPIAAIFLNHANFSSVTIRASDDPAFGSFTTVGTFSIQQDSRVQNRRKSICEFASIATNNYVRLIPASADAGATFWSLGQVVAVNVENWQRMPEPAAPPYNQTRAKAVSIDETPGATQHVTAEGAAYFAGEFGAELWTMSSGQWARMMDLLGIGMNAPFLLYEDAGTAAGRANAYMLWRTGASQVSDEAGRIFGTRIRARETI